jgi:Secretion system C-terminal sorting domain
MKGLLKKCITAICFAVMFFSLHAQDTPYFSRVYDFGGLTDFSTELVVYQDSMIFVQGNTRDSSSFVLSNVLFRLDWKGNISWKRFIKDTSHKYNVYTGFAFDVSGDQIVIPSLWFGNNDRHSSLTAFTIAGDSLWQQKYYGDELQIEAVLRNKNGYILTGTERDSITKYDIFLMQVDTMGKEIWRKRYRWNGYDLADNLALSPDGGIIIGAYSDTFTTKKVIYGNPLVIKTDSLGNIEWMRDFGGPNSPGNEPAAHVSITKDSFIIMASGYSFPNAHGLDPSRGIIAKMNMQGDVVWQKFYGKLGERTKLLDIIETKTGDYVAVGIHNNYEYLPLAWIIKVGTSGNTIWERFHAKYQEESTGHYFSNVGELADGSFVAGDMIFPNYQSGLTQDIWVVRTDSLGCWFAGCDTMCVDPPKITYSLEKISDTLYRVVNTTKNSLLRFIRVGTWFDTTDQSDYKSYSTNGDTLFFGLPRPAMVYVTIRVQDPCNLWSGIYDSTWIVPVGINKLDIKNKISVFPNPFNQTLQIRFEQATAKGLQLQIIDISGRMLLQKEITAGSQRENVNTSALPPGIYLYRIGNDEHGWQTGKVVKTVSGF